MNRHLLVKTFTHDDDNPSIIKTVKIQSDLWTSEIVFVLQDDSKKQALELLKLNNVMVLIAEEGLRVTASLFNMSNIAKAFKLLKENNFIATTFVENICKNYPIGRDLPNYSSRLLQVQSKSIEKLDDISKPNSPYGFHKESSYKRPNLNNIPSIDKISSLYEFEAVALHKNDDDSLEIEFNEQADFQWSKIETINSQLQINSYRLGRNKNGNPWIQLFPCDVDNFSQNLHNLFIQNEKSYSKP